MSKKFWALAAFAGGVGAAGALGARKYVEYYRPGGLPGREELDEYFDGLSNMIGLPGLLDTIEEDWLESDGLRLHLDILPSDPSDPTLVFIPGTTAYSALYAEFLHKMRLQGFNVVGLDPRGHGRSQGRRGSYTVNELLRDALAAVEYARRRFGDRVAISGSSQGGIVSFYAAAADDTLKGAVCHNIALFDEPEVINVTRWPALSRFAFRLKPLAPLFGELRVPVTSYLDLKKEMTRFGFDALEFIKKDPLEVLAISLKAMVSLATTPPPKPAEQITVPIMVIQGKRDTLFTVDYTRSIYDRLTCDREFLLVKEAPHLVLTNNVDEIAPEIAAWLNARM
jgi:alpha-beta hydrolase superfamily lysophospholipase